MHRGKAHMVIEYEGVDYLLCCPQCQAGLLKKARGVLMQRTTDPWESDYRGVMNTIVPEPHFPSHQGLGAQTVAPYLNVMTMAVKASHTQTHNHYWIVVMTREYGADSIQITDEALGLCETFLPANRGV